ncbi:AcrR family transcriptional regulator [Chitinivorax tropicus]|uniref:AcrR family transcriptional regulator n=1 Tax=Chitinivorax tropicus TaxID=714531 RepID=A0A840MGC5_9PROT|nr:TetR/AcrR family transcriptional regulator [Chitinivorax tropicus]MBB5018294.1 AcrR family transcriptional regulator [Chitinivorax tropicus]
MSVKTRLLEAGVTLLKTRGFAALTQPQVAAQAGVKQSHLTYYFPTRTDLLIAIAEYTVDSLLVQAAAQLTQAPNGKTLQELILHVMLEGVPPRVIVGLIAAADSDPAIRLSLDRLICHARQAMPMLLQVAGLRAGTEDVLLFHATMVGLAIMHQARLNDESAADLRSGLERLIQCLTPSV